MANHDLDMRKLQEELRRLTSARTAVVNELGQNRINKERLQKELDAMTKRIEADEKRMKDFDSEIREAKQALDGLSKI